MRALIAAIVFCWCGLVLASGQPSRPTGQPVAPAQQQQAALTQQAAQIDERGSEQAPFVVKLYEAQENNKVANREEADRRERTNADWWVIFIGKVTALILIVQAGVFIFQGYQLRETVKEMKTATKATLKVAEEAAAIGDAAKAAFLAAHRPRLIVRQVSISELVIDPELTSSIGAISYTIANTGNLPTTIVECRIQIRHGGDNRELEIIDDGRPIYEGPPGACVGKEVLAGASIRETYVDEGSAVADFIALAKMGRPQDVPFGLFGYITYEDEMKVQRTTAFWRRYSNETGRFVAADDPDYEYQD
jgi:hypothetical protein